MKNRQQVILENCCTRTAGYRGVSIGGVSVCGRMCAFVWKQDCLHLCMARDSGQVRLNDDLCGHVQQV